MFGYSSKIVLVCSYVWCIFVDINLPITLQPQIFINSADILQAVVYNQCNNYSPRFVGQLAKTNSNKFCHLSTFARKGLPEDFSTQMTMTTSPSFPGAYGGEIGGDFYCSMPVLHSWRDPSPRSRKEPAPRGILTNSSSAHCAVYCPVEQTDDPEFDFEMDQAIINLGKSWYNCKRR